MGAASIAIFDSGLGGLTILRQIRARMADANCLYVADNAAFPYGNLSEDELVVRMLALFDLLIERERPDICVIACNTASTIALEPLREHFPQTPFVGTVPAVKVAAENTRSKMFSVLATPGTVEREYTHDLIWRFASGCDVTLVGAPSLAGMAERFMRGEKLDEDLLKREIAPAFVEKDSRRTDMIALACTHYPLLAGAMEKIAPWPVKYIDPAPAIARQTEMVLSRLSAAAAERNGEKAENQFSRFVFTGSSAIARNMEDFLLRLHIDKVYHDSIIG